MSNCWCDRGNRRRCNSNSTGMWDAFNSRLKGLAHVRGVLELHGSPDAGHDFVGQLTGNFKRCKMTAVI